MKKCLVCASVVEEFISFGKMPIANGFLKLQEFSAEYFFELKVGFCPSCKMVQLTELVDREKMFHENYAFFSSTSSRMARHFSELAHDVQREFLMEKDSFVVEIGSNDGITLQHFKNKDIRHLGIEPSQNVAQVATEKGIKTWTRFFDKETAQDIVKEFGQADVFMGSNVMCHIPYVHSVLEGVKVLLKPKGVMIFEDPYLGDIVEKVSYDQIYDEHAFYFSLLSVSQMVKSHGLELIDARPQPVHGGSMRYYIAHKGQRSKSVALDVMLKKERALKLDQFETFKELARNVVKSRDSLRDLLQKLKREGKRVVGYGATSKSTTVTNYCQITPDLVEFISDTTPIKQGKYSPGVHIPVQAYERFKERYPDYALLFAWNHADEIMSKEDAFLKAGGNWIVYVPKVQIVK
jgi:methylation protein EvaC